MKYKFCALLLALFCSAAMSFPVSAADTPKSSSEAIPDEAAYFGNSDLTLRGLYVDSAYNKDYPATVNSTAALMSDHADKIVSFAKENNFNTIIYPVSPRADAVYRSNYLPSSRYTVSEEGNFIISDPLNVLLETADMEHVNVVSSLSMLYAGEVNDKYSGESPVMLHPDWFITQGSSLYFNPNKPEVREFWVSVVKELVSNYSLDGVILSDLDALDESYSSGVTLLVEQCMQVIRSQDENLSAGISLSHTAVDSDQWLGSLEALKPIINFIIPQMKVSTYSAKSYSDYLEQWAKLLDESDARLYTANQANLLKQPLTDELIFGDERELSYQLYSNSLMDCDGFAVHSYSDISGLKQNLAYELTLVPENTSSAVQKLNSYEASGLSLVDGGKSVKTIHTSYYLSGHCNPDKPLYINGEELDPAYINEDGYWGKLMDLKRGSNVFAIRQDKENQRIMVYSSIQAADTVQKIDDILEDSVYPSYDEVLFEGEALVLSCIAPYGGDVMAMFNGNTYHLLPPEDLSEKDIGSAVEYSLEIPLMAKDSTVTENFGRINYILTYNDFSSKYRSEGQIYLVGSSSRLTVEVTDTVGCVYQSLENDAIISKLSTGTCDYAYNSADPNYFRLYSGGYISKKDVKVNEGIVDIQRSIEAVGIQRHEQGENLIFVGGSGLPYYSNFNEHTHTLIFQLSNVVDMPSSLSYLSTELFDSITVTHDEYRSTSTLRFHLAEGKQLWGYQVSYENGNLYLKCKTAPTLSSDIKQPLSGVSFVLDAAYGGVEDGGKTVIGEHGIPEKDINLAYAQSLRRRLESLGAEVTLTRNDDTTMDKEDRTLYSAYKDADFYISFRCESSESNFDGQSSEGISISFDTELAAGLGNMIYHQLPQLLNIPSGKINSNDPDIAKVPLAKAVIISPGTLTSPDDYSRLTDPLEIYRSSCYLSDLLIQYIRTF